MALLFRTELGGGSSIEPYTVIVSLDEEFKGQPVTLTQGTEIMHKTCPMTAPYEVEFKPMNDGVWVASSTTKDGKVVSVDTEPLLEWGTYNVTLESGFNFREWLNRGRVEKTFTSLDDVLADEPTVRQLMTVHDSVDYLVTALSNDADTAGKILDNDICAKWINLRDYALDMLYANANVKAVMDSVDKYGYGEWALIDGTWQPKGAVPIMTSDTAPYGEVIKKSTLSGKNAYSAFDGNVSTEWRSKNETSSYIGYKFTNPICVKMVSYIQHYSETTPRINTFKIQGSNDNTNWTDLTATITAERDSTQPNKKYYADVDADEYYLYIRMSITSTITNGVTELQFYGRELKVSVPTMTSNTEPWGVVTATDYYKDNYDTYDPWRAFSNATDRGWLPANYNDELVYDFGYPVLVKKMTLRNAKQASTETSKVYYDLFGSIDGQKYDLIQNDVNCYTHRNDLFTYSINTNKYRFYKLVCTKNDNGRATSGYGCILQFYGLDYSEKEFAQDGKVEYIYDHDIELMALTKTSSSALVTFDTTNCKTLRATLGKYATTSDKIQCGSANATLNGNPFSLGLNITNVNGNNATGFGNINVANMGDTSLWVENK